MKDGGELLREQEQAAIGGRLLIFGLLVKKGVFFKA
jgi:hypothetical protein